MKRFWIYFVVFGMGGLALAESNVTLQGRLREKGTRKPLADFNIFVLPSKAKAVTDADGNFSVEVPAGDFTWVINGAGYLKLERPDTQSAEGENRPRNFFLERASYGVYETTVYDREDKKRDAKQTMKAAEILNMPGAGGDAIKAVQNLPGVNRPLPFQSQVIIQGSAPIDTRYAIDGHEVPLIFHFGGLSSVIPTESIDRVDFLSAGYGTDYGRALGGIIGVWTKNPRRDRLHGLAFVDLFNSGLLLEAPVGGGALMIGARKSYIGEVLKTALKDNENFNLTVAPSFSDLVALYEFEPSEDDKVRVLGVGSLDTLEFLFNQPVNQDPSIRGTFKNKTAFVRLIPQYAHRFSEATNGKLSLGVGRDWIRVDASDNFFSVAATQLTTRGEIEHQLTPSWTAQWGIDNTFTWADVSLRLPSFYNAGGVNNPVSTGERKEVDVSSTAAALGAYWANEIKLADTPWAFLPSLRGEYYSPTKQGLLLPRAIVRYRIDDTFVLRTGAGLYAQPPLEQQIDRTYGNPDVKAPRAWHWIFGAEKDFRDGGTEGWLVTGNVFYKGMTELVNPSARLVTRDGAIVSENYRNDGSGKAYGVSLSGKGVMMPWSFMFSYTLSRSLRTDSLQTDYPFQFDQTHFLTAVASYELGRNWRLAARLRYATGNPTTPIVGGTFDADNDVYIPQRGAFYSERLEPFFQFDLRVDKKWIFNSWILSAYLDIQNLTNRKNLESIRYAYDYQSRTTVSGLPILPTLGVRAEF